jgi:hypothetical protein
MAHSAAHPVRALTAARRAVTFGPSAPPLAAATLAAPPLAARPRVRAGRRGLALASWAIACLALISSTASMLYFARDARRSRATLARIADGDEVVRLKRENQVLRERLQQATSL